jgi:hypothetical protein
MKKQGLSRASLEEMVAVDKEGDAFREERKKSKFEKYTFVRLWKAHLLAQEPTVYLFRQKTR